MDIERFQIGGVIEIEDNRFKQGGVIKTEESKFLVFLEKLIEIWK